MKGLKYDHPFLDTLSNLYKNELQYLVTHIDNLLELVVRVGSPNVGHQISHPYVVSSGCEGQLPELVLTGLLNTVQSVSHWPNLTNNLICSHTHTWLCMTSNLHLSLSFNVIDSVASLLCYCFCHVCKWKPNCKAINTTCWPLLYDIISSFEL
jgi:hypothetical protein